MGAGSILAINLIVAGFLAAAFLFLAAYDRRRVAGNWMALGYGFSMVYFALEFAIANVGRHTPLLVAAFAAFLSALGAMNVGLARRYAATVPWRLLGAIFIVSVAVNIGIQGLPRASFPRQMLYQAPYFVMAALGAMIVFRSPKRRGLDSLLVGLLAAFSFHFLAKPFLAASLGGVGSQPAAYIQTSYALVSQAMGTVFAMAIAILMLMILVRDIYTDITARSETDELSGLLNRRGFEDRARACFRRALQTGMPVSLVICDLDRFKTVNDTFGHAAGDNVIVAFSGCLRGHLGPSHIAGRIGGEEFAVILPDATLSGARLFAESVRAAFAAAPVDGLPDLARMTASFGVAELIRGEHFSDLLNRADGALYGAKNAGRDRVGLAPAANDSLRASLTA